MSPDDFLFRNLLLVIFAIIFLIAFFFRIRSHTGEKLDRSQEGLWILLGIRIGAVPWFLGLLIWLIKPALLNWASVALPVSLRWAGIVFLVLWGTLLFWCFSHLGKNLTDTVVTRENHTLVKSGPYRFIRHPFYLAFFIAILGIFLVSSNLFLLLSAIIPSAFLLARIPIEEQKLIDRFGDEYSEYMKRTGRFLPRFRS